MGGQTYGRGVLLYGRRCETGGGGGRKTYV